MSLKTDKVQLEIIMKSDTTRAEIIKLEDQAKSLKKEMGKLKNDPAELAKASAEYDKVTNRIKDLRNSIDLTGMTMRELQDKSKMLSMQLRNLTPGSAKFNEMDAELKKINARMKELRGTAAQTQSSFGNLANGFNKYFAISTAFIASVTGVSLAFRKLAEDVAHMDDVYSDVMKTTNLSKEQVLELNESFKKMDTRTSRESLNMLARDAGKLGKESSKDILDFVEAGNQINVALGEDLGEDAIKNIGKMVGVFQRSTKELQGLGLKEQMLAVGSAINALGAASSADEGYLVSFAGRLGGIAKQAGISMDAILGFGSALDQDMQQVEMSATALQNFIMKLMADPAKFAKLAGLEVKGFTKLLNEDANAAIKQVLRAMNEKGGFQQLIPMFEGMGLEGARAVGVLSSMAGSIDKVDEAQKLANKSMADGTSITKEYNIKNDNLAARLDKAKKAFQETALELGASLNPMLLSSVKGTTYLIRTMVELPKWLKENKGLLLTLAIVMGTYAITVNRAWIASMAQLALEKLKIIWTRASTAATLLQVAVTGYLTGATRAANLATKTFFATLGLNPFVAIGVALAAVTIGLYKWVTANKEANLVLEANNNIQKKIDDQYGDQEAKIKSLVTVLNSELFSLEERRKALEELKKIVPDYHASLTDEGKLINDNKIVLDQYLVSLEKEIRIQATKDELIELYKKKRLQEKELAIKEQNAKNAAAGAKQTVIGEGQFSQGSRGLMAAQSGMFAEAARAELEKTKTTILAIEMEYANLSKKPKAIDPNSNNPNGNDPNGNNSKQKKIISIDSLKAEIDSLNKELNAVEIGSKKFYQLKKEIAEKQRQLDAAEGKKPKKDKSIDDAYEKALKEKEKVYKEAQFELMELRRTGQMTEEVYNDIALQTQLAFLKEKMVLQGVYKKDTVDTEIEISNQKTKIGNDADKASLESIKATQDAGLMLLEQTGNTKEEMLQEALDRGIIKEREYNLEMKKLAVELNAAKLALAQASLTALEKVNFNDKETQKKALADAKAEIAKLQEALLNAQGAVAKDVAKGVEKEAKSVAERMQGIFGNSFSNIGNLFTKFTEGLDKLKSGDLKSWDDWAKAIGGVVEAGLGVATQINDEYFANKAAALEADKQRELTNAGDNAQAREEINQKYAQKELDLKKKQSSADTFLKVAQAIAAGGLAIVQAFAQLGPVGGAIAAVLIGGITAFQVDTIVKQNAAIQATTLDSSGSGGDTAPKSTGARVVSAPQAADGRYDVIGAQDGKMYKNVRYAGVARSGFVHKPTLMGEAGTELIIDAPTLSRLNMKAPGFNNFVLNNRVNQRAEGNYAAINGTGGNGANGADNSALMSLLIGTIDKNNSLLQYLAENRIEAYTLLSEFEKTRDLRDKSLTKGSLK